MLAAVLIAADIAGGSIVLVADAAARRTLPAAVFDHLARIH